MTDTSIPIAANRFIEVLKFARSAVNHAAANLHMEEFALTGEGDLLFHSQEVPREVLWTIPTEDRREVLERILYAFHIEFDNLGDDEDGVVA